MYSHQSASKPPQSPEDPTPWAGRAGPSASELWRSVIAAGVVSPAAEGRLRAARDVGSSVDVGSVHETFPVKPRDLDARRLFRDAGGDPDVASSVVLAPRLWELLTRELVAHRRRSRAVSDAVLSAATKLLTGRAPGTERPPAPEQGVLTAIPTTGVVGLGLLQRVLTHLDAVAVLSELGLESEGGTLTVVRPSGMSAVGLLSTAGKETPAERLGNALERTTARHGARAARFDSCRTDYASVAALRQRKQRFGPPPLMLPHTLTHLFRLDASAVSRLARKITAVQLATSAWWRALKRAADLLAVVAPPPEGTPPAKADPDPTARPRLHAPRRSPRRHEVPHPPPSRSSVAPPPGPLDVQDPLVQRILTKADRGAALPPRPPATAPSAAPRYLPRTTDDDVVRAVFRRRPS